MNKSLEKRSATLSSTTCKTTPAAAPAPPKKRKRAKGPVFEVDKILAFRHKKNTGEEYLIRWKDFECDFDTWEPVINLRGSEDLLAEFRFEDKSYHRYCTKTGIPLPVKPEVNEEKVEIMVAKAKPATAIKPKTSAIKSEAKSLKAKPETLLDFLAKKRIEVECFVHLPLVVPDSEELDAVIPIESAQSPIQDELAESPELIGDLLTETFKDNFNNNQKVVLPNASINNPWAKKYSPPIQRAMQRLKLDPDYDITHMWSEILAPHKGSQITVYNDLDDCIYPTTPFTYINASIYAPNVPAFDPSFLVGCSVEGSDCSKDSECYEVSGKPHYSKRGRIKLPKHSMITECGSWCKCNTETCHNRVISRGSDQLFQIFRTKKCGWGVRTLRNIPKNTFVVRYVGEIIDDIVEGEKRGEIYDNLNCTYLFALDFYDGVFDRHKKIGTPSPRKISPSSSVESSRSQPQYNEYTIDAFNMGNVSRFINHHCEGNLDVYPFSRDNQDPRLHEVAFFANRDILSGEELCYNYSGGQVYDKDTPNVIACHCGSKICTGRMMG